MFKIIKLTKISKVPENGDAVGASVKKYSVPLIIGNSVGSLEGTICDRHCIIK